MRHQRADLLGVAGDQLQTDRGAPAVPVHVRRLVPRGGEDRGSIVRVQRDRDVLGLAFERAPRVAPRVVGDRRVPVRQPPGQVREHARVGRPAGDQQQHRTRSLRLDVQRGARNLHGLRHGSTSFRRRCLEQLPFAGHPSEVGVAQRNEGKIIARRQVPDGSGDDHLPLPRFGQQPSGDVDADPAHIPLAHDDLSRVDRRADAEPRVAQ